MSPPRPLPPPMGCGGCALPPICGEVPSPCSCGCFPGERFDDLVCTEAGCLARFDASIPIDASDVDAAVCAGRDYCSCTTECRPIVDLAEGCFCEFDDPFNCSAAAGSCVCGGARYAGCAPTGRCTQRLRCGTCGTVVRDGCPVCDPTCGDGGLPDAGTDAGPSDAGDDDAGGDDAGT